MIQKSFGRIESYIYGCISFYDDTKSRTYANKYLLVRQTDVSRFLKWNESCTKLKKTLKKLKKGEKTEKTIRKISLTF